MDEPNWNTMHKLLEERDQARAQVQELAKAVRAWWLEDGATEDELFTLLARYE